MPPVIDIPEHRLIRFCKRDLWKPIEESALHEFDPNIRYLDDLLESKKVEEIQDQIILDIVVRKIFLNGMRSVVVFDEENYGSMLRGDWRIQVDGNWMLDLGLTSNDSTFKYLRKKEELYLLFCRFLSLQKFKKIDSLLKSINPYESVFLEWIALEEQLEKKELALQYINSGPDNLSDLKLALNGVNEVNSTDIDVSLTGLEEKLSEIKTEAEKAKEIMFKINQLKSQYNTSLKRLLKFDTRLFKETNDPLNFGKHMFSKNNPLA